MRAARFAEYGGPEVLHVVEVEEPHAGPGQVRIKVHAAGVNGIDWKLRAGLMREMFPLPLPAGTGLDAAGVVDEVGAGVTDVTIGDAVFGTGSATLAERAVLTDWAKKPDGLSFEEAAGYPVPVATATRILDLVGIQPGQTLLVSGASGGVGSAVLQLARQRGIIVIGTASAKNHAYVRSLGALVTTYGPGLGERVKALAPGGVDAALDLAGSGVLPDLIALVGTAERVLTIADLGAQKHGVRFSAGGPQDDRRPALEEAARLFAEGAFRIPVERTFSLAEAADAHAASAAGHARGRLVVRIAPPTVSLDPEAGLVTVINTYVVAPDRVEALLDHLVRATDEVLRHMPGFVSASFHVSDDRTRLVNYAQWRSHEAIVEAGFDPRVTARIQEAAKLVESFAPVRYELRRSLSVARE